MSAMLSGGGFVTELDEMMDDGLPTASQSTLLLQKKKEMAEVQQQLDRKKEEFRARMQRCQEKEVDLAARQEDIKEQVRKFDKFLKDNDAKRVRADRKVQEEKKALHQKEIERHELLEVLSAENAKRDMLEGEVASNSKYQRFLDSVCEDPSMSEYFESIENITMRYETLAAAHDDLRDRVDSAQQQQEKENAELVGYIRSTQNEHLVYNSDISNMQFDLDRLRQAATDSEAQLARRETKGKEGMRESGEIKMAIQNIYGRCVKQRQRGQQTPDELGDFLEAIKQRVCDLQSIVTSHEGPVHAHELTIHMPGKSGAGGGQPSDEGSPGKAANASAANAASKAGGGTLTSSVSPSGVMRSGDISTSAANVRSSAKLGGAGEEGGSGTPSFSGAMASKAALQ